MLRHAFVSNSVFGLCLLNMLLLFSLVLYLICLVLRVSRVFWLCLPLFVEYADFIFSDVVFALLGSARFPCIMALFTSVC
jgi:hypothetical protein